MEVSGMGRLPLDHGGHRATPRSGGRTVIYDYLRGSRLAEFEGKAPMKPIVRQFTSIESREVRWLWPGVLSVGKLTLLAGDPGLGKSFISIDCAARLSRGGPWPCDDGHRIEPQGTVLLSAEDDANDTIKPRLEKAGADLSMVHILDGLRMEDGMFEDFDLSRHVSTLESVVETTPNIGLVVIDPISAFTGGVDTHSNASVRGMLKPLADFAGDYSVSVLCVTHLRKSGNGPMVHRAMGSLAFAAAARIVYAVTKDRNDPESRMFCPIKSNISQDRIGYRYAIEDGLCVWDPRTFAVSADEAAEGAGQRVSENQRQWLADVLRHGPVAVSEIERLCGLHGHSFESIRRVIKVSLRVKSQRVGDGWAWSLPEQEGKSRGEATSLFRP